MQGALGKASDVASKATETAEKAQSGIKKAIDVAKKAGSAVTDNMNRYNTYTNATIFGGGKSDDAAETEDATGTTANADASNVDVNANDQKPTKSLDEIFAKYKKG